MKKIMNKINMAIIAAMVSMPAMAVETYNIDGGMCDLLKKMHGVFSTLRVLAFIGAAFIVAGWAWGYISAGDVKLDDLKKKGTGMLVGFILLFAIGIALSFFMSQAGLDLVGCGDIIKKW